MAVYKTAQRKMLLDFLGANRGRSFTAREITSLISDIHGADSPSESTIYRLMRELVNDGTVMKNVNVENRENVYCLPEVKTGVSIRCRVCGNVYGVDNESSSRIKNEISKCGEAVPEENIEFLIKCRKCR